jgi:hypothetical protein
MRHLTLDSIVTVNGQQVRVGDLTADERTLFGVGHGYFGPSDLWRVTTERLPGDWPYEPGTCPASLAWFWTRGGGELFCCGCGTNGT